MITWSIRSMMVKKQEAGQTDVVYMVDWLAVATEDVTPPDAPEPVINEARCGGSVEVPAPTGNFTPYDHLTESQVIDWVWAVMGNDAKLALEANLEAQLLYMKTPPVLSLPLPWNG